jgi:hypothetical protein
MEDEIEEYYYGLWPKEPEYPPIIPAELKACLDKAPKMLNKLGELQDTLDRALVVLQSAQQAVEAELLSSQNNSGNADKSQPA